MTKYNTWDEYLTSEQDVYLDEYNCADCNIQFECNGFKVYGQTLLKAYEICTDCNTVCILTNADILDVFETIKSFSKNKKKKYRVTCEIVVDVEAEDEDVATRLAEEEWNNGNYVCCHYIAEIE